MANPMKKLKRVVKRARVGRKRDAAATRADILAAARQAFSSSGYDSVGVRDIAAKAGVTAALVNRYFGSKKLLFSEAVLEAKGIGELLTGDRRTAGARLAAMMLDKDPHGKGGGDPLLAILRSAPDPEAAGVVREWLQKVMVGPIAKWLGGPDAETRASVMVSTLLGFIILRQAIALPGLSAGRGDALREMMSAALQSQIDASSPLNT
jgi:AcrR family transcriptional regulator